MKRLIIWAFVIIGIWVTGCSETKPPSDPNQKSVVIYGSRQCSHCIEFMEKMDEKGFGYRFNDVDESDDYALEMVNVVRKSGYGGRINFPVVVIEDQTVLVSPEFEVVARQL